MGEIKKWTDENVPESAFVSLIADGRAKELYAQFGFVETGALSVAMALPLKGMGLTGGDDVDNALVAPDVSKLTT